MAADWIKIEHSLPGKPEVMELSRLLNIDEMTVVGHLVCFWSWVDQNLSPECPHASGTKRGLDRVAGRDGFVDAMAQVGWLSFDGHTVTIPNYDHHLSQSAKKRGSEARKKTRQRSVSQKCPVTNGTESGQKEGLEKRRKESISFSYSETQNAIVVPKKMQTPEVQQAVTHWLTHLESKDPLKVPQADSPQMQALWHKWSALGPERLVAAIWHSSSEGFMTLHEPPAARAVGASGGKPKLRTPLDSIDWGDESESN